MNFLLIPRFGIVGAAWANGAAYFIQAVLGYLFSQRFYPIPYEWNRILRACASAMLAFLAARLLPSIRFGVDPRSSLAHAPDVLLRGTVVVATFGALIASTGFLRPAEISRLRRIARRRRATEPAGVHPDAVEQAGEIVSADVTDGV